MNTLLNKSGLVRALMLSAILPTQLLAAQYTVNSPADPAVGDPAACTSGSVCTLRDALAAADQAADLDVVLFELSETIFLNRSLLATHPVVIDGGGTTSIRVSQAYTVALLPDRPAFGDGIVQVLQPHYYSEGGGKRAMIQLFGPGSVIANLELDGSISPLPTDLGVARIDYESDDVTNFLLYTVEGTDPGHGPRWPIAGGLETKGSATVNGNQLRYFDNVGVTVEASAFSSVTNNEIIGGAAGQARFSGDGVFVFASIHTTISGNIISGYRSGVSVFFASSMDIHANELSGNVTGIDIDSVGPDYGTNRVRNNLIDTSLFRGLSFAQSGFIEVLDNEVSDSAETGVHFKASGEIDLVGNRFRQNGSGAREHGGIAITEGSGQIRLRENESFDNHGFGLAISAGFANLVENNELTGNAGAGLVLVSGAGQNQVRANEIKGNFAGIMAGVEGETWFPSGNTFENNQLLMNVGIDALDYDPVCNDTWSGNTIGTFASVSPGCIQP